MAIICKYKFNSTLCADYLPEFNSEFTGYTKTDVDNGDNTITRTIEHDTLLPTLIRFGTTGDITDRERSLLELIECYTSNVNNMYAMFRSCTSLTSLDLSNFDTSKVTSMGHMFDTCKSLSSLDLSNFDTINVTTMREMFRHCSLLATLDLSNFNTSNVTNMGYMFNNCNKLTSLDVSNFDTSNVTYMAYMFHNCNKLTTLDISNFDTSNVTDMYGIFSYSNKLTTLDISNFDTSKVISIGSMFYNCPSLSDIGMVYCTKSTIDKVSPLVEHICNIYVNSVIPENCTPVDGITFIYDGYVKTLYLNSPLLEGDTIEEKDDGIYYIHRYTETMLDGSLFNNMDSDMNGLHRYYSYNYRCLNYALGENKCYCDKLPVSTMPKIDGSITFSGSGYIEYATTKSMSEAQEWLQQNSVTIVYELAEPTYELIEQSNLAIPSYANGHLNLASAVPVSKVNFLHFEEELTYLYPSTSYTVQFISDKAISIDITLGGTQLLAQNIVKGLNRIAITTPSKLANSKLVIDGVGASISEVVVTDTDRKFGYFEGMKSVGECEGLEVLSSNKNLFNGKTEQGAINNTTGESTGSSTRVRTYYIKVKPNTSYCITKNISDDYFIHHYDINKNKTHTMISIGSTIDSQVISTTSSTEYIRIRSNNKSQLDFSLVESNIIIDYVPYAENKTEILLNEPLRAVGDIKDKYVLIDGKWYIERNCGEVVLDGTQPIVVYITDTHVKYAIFNNNNNTINIKMLSTLSCDKYPYIGAVYNQTVGEGIGSHSEYGIRFNFLLSNFNNPADSSEFSDILRNNPVTVVYELATPTYEPIDYNPFTVYSDTTHISNNSTIPANMVIKNTGYNCLLKPSTTYTVSSNLGLNTVTTPSVLSEDCLRFYDTDTSSVTTMKNVTILEGDYTTGKPIPSHFSGIESAFEQEYDEAVGKYKVRAKVVGKNLFNAEKHNNTYYQTNGDTIIISNNRSGAVSNDKRWVLFSNIPKNYSLSFTVKINSIANSQAGFLGIKYKDTSVQYITVNNSDILKTVTFKKDVDYISILNWSLLDGYMYNIQLEQGTEATPYEPYKENYIEFYINEPLRGIEDVKDKVYVKNDKVAVERKCGSVTFDGSADEGWVRHLSSSDEYFVAITDFNKDKKKNGCIPYSNNFINKNVIGSSREGFNMRTSEFCYLTIKSLRLNENTINGFKQWLQQNPTTLVYELAEPIYEEVEYSESRLFLNTYNNSTLFYESNIPVSNTSFKPLWEELVYLKNSTKYYIQFNAVGSGEVVINLGGTELTTEIVEGYNCIPITTPSESTNLMTIIGQGITISEVVVSEVVCGGYYKGLQSCFEEHMENGKYRVLLRGIALDGSKVNGIKLYINEPLRGVNDTKDRLCIKNGKLMVERKCGEIVFDGSEDEIFKQDFGLINPTVMQTIYNVSNISGREDNQYAISSDNFISQKGSSMWSQDIEGVGLGASHNRGIKINILLSKLNTQDIDGFKQWLSENPTTVVYELAEPTYEEVTNEYGLPIVLEGYENGIVYIDSAVIPTTSIKYTSNNVLATTLSETKGQNNSTQDDINVNVVTYMMDIDMLLTEMEMSNDISVMAVRRDNNNENMLDRMSEEDKKVYQDNTVVMLEKMITAKALEKEDIERRINMYYNKNRISKEQYKYLKSLL